VPDQSVSESIRPPGPDGSISSLSTMGGGAPPTRRESPWTEMLDGRSGRAYYFNRETGESQWENPEVVTRQEAYHPRGPHHQHQPAVDYGQATHGTASLNGAGSAHPGYGPLMWHDPGAPRRGNGFVASRGGTVTGGWPGARAYGHLPPRQPATSLVSPQNRSVAPQRELIRRGGQRLVYAGQPHMDPRTQALPGRGAGEGMARGGASRRGRAARGRGVRGVPRGPSSMMIDPTFPSLIELQQTTRGPDAGLRDAWRGEWERLQMMLEEKQHLLVWLPQPVVQLLDFCTRTYPLQPPAILYSDVVALLDLSPILSKDFEASLVALDPNLVGVGGSGRGASAARQVDELTLLRDFICFALTRLEATRDLDGTREGTGGGLGPIIDVCRRIWRKAADVYI
jgi:hypothetical protein